MAKKQIDGQISLFDFISEEEKKAHHNRKNKSDNVGKAVSLYRDCINCWCSTCRHNAKKDAIPRDFAGEQKPCPSCDFCVSSKKAEICEIGSYKNGCRLRAEEEGIVSPVR